MKKGTVLKDIEMIDISSNGKAVGKYDGRIVFVNDLVPGDVADVEVYRKKRKFLEANPVNLSKSSKFRIEPTCIHFGTCGGCKWQNLTYSAQLQYKSQQVKANLEKISGMKIPSMLPIIGSDQIYNYRNKLEFTFTEQRWLTDEEISSGEEITDRKGLGFHIPGMFDKVLDIRECHLQNDLSNSIRNFIREESVRLEIPYFNLREQSGILRNLIIRNTTKNEWMIVLSVTEFNEQVEKLLNAVSMEFPQLNSINYVVNQKKNDTILDLPVVRFKGEGHITESLFHLTYRIGPKSFFQTNPVQAAKLYSVIREFADLNGGELVYDLYTGTGSIANFLAEKAGKVIGLEYVEEAVSDARLNAELNDIDNTEFFAGDLKDLLTEEFISDIGQPDVIITDPPRAGMHEDVLKAMNHASPKRIVYVSCNPASQGRDLKILSESYAIEKVQPVDMFPHTSHIENVVLLVKK